jgi:hypothetical protein
MKYYDNNGNAVLARNWICFSLNDRVEDGFVAKVEGDGTLIVHYGINKMCKISPTEDDRGYFRYNCIKSNTLEDYTSEEYPWFLRYRIDEDGAAVFPIQSEMEDIVLNSVPEQRYNQIYHKDGFKIGNGNATLTYDDSKLGWVLR